MTCLCFFFFQAEDGIRDRNVTGVQTCALPILRSFASGAASVAAAFGGLGYWAIPLGPLVGQIIAFPIYWSAEKFRPGLRGRDRKSTRLNSSHVSISYAVFCLKKKKQDVINEED